MGLKGMHIFDCIWKICHCLCLVAVSCKKVFKLCLYGGIVLDDQYFKIHNIPPDDMIILDGRRFHKKQIWSGREGGNLVK